MYFCEILLCPNKPYLLEVSRNFTQKLPYFIVHSNFLKNFPKNYSNYYKIYSNFPQISPFKNLFRNSSHVQQYKITPTLADVLLYAHYFFELLFIVSSVFFSNFSKISLIFSRCFLEISFGYLKIFYEIIPKYFENFLNFCNVSRQYFQNLSKSCAGGHYISSKMLGLKFLNNKPKNCETLVGFIKTVM